MGHFNKNSAKMNTHNIIVYCLLHIVYVEATGYCSCSQVTVWSSGATLDQQPQILGSYSHAGSIWEDMVNYYKNGNYFLTVDPYSNPNFQVNWVVSTEWLSAPGDYSKIFLKSTGSHQGVSCPWEQQLEWQVKGTGGG